jgi:DNA primase large subunit
MASFGAINKKRLQGSAITSTQKRIKICVYDKPPQGELSLHEFEQFALDRMRVLKAIDAAKAKGMKPAELKETIDKLCLQYLPLRDIVLMELEEDLRKDQISHFILRMAYSRTEELRRWFLRQEEALFKHRFNALDADARTQAMRMLQQGGIVRGEEVLSTITEEAWTIHQEQLLAVFGNMRMNDDSSKDPVYFHTTKQPWNHIYKVPFEQVIDLVAQRRVFLSDGEAFVHSRDLSSAVLTSFRSRLSRNLTENARAFHDKSEEEIERLGPLLQNLTNAYLGPAFASGNASAGRITLDQLPAVMNNSAPLCMRSPYQILADHHHLKHDARMQFGLFLKGIGVTMEDSLAFWREAFMKGGMTSEKFDKQYAYNIRHNYGAEGKRTNYTPFSCVKIINATPMGDLAGHGCPYKHWDAGRLHRELSSMRLSPTVVSDVIDKAKNHHYQVACMKVYEALHPTASIEEGLNHPNQYFQASLEYYEQKAEKEGKGKGAAAKAEGKTEQEAGDMAVEPTAA